jgi:hypothetical protein
MATITRKLFEFLPALSDHNVNDGNAQQHVSTEALLQKALDAPIDHPKLAESIFPGDRVSILVQNGLPAACETLESLISILENSRIETANVRVIVPQPMAKVFDLVETASADPEAKTPTTHRMKSDQREPPICFEIHDTDDEHASCYLAANEQGNPVYVNRSLCDSDVILPLSSLTPNKKLSDCLYPEFSTSETRARYRKKDDSVKQRIAEAELANDSLGLFFSIELICSPGGVIDDIVCGSRSQTRQIAADMLQSRWEIQSDDENDVVVTTIESSSESATWSNVVRAVVAAAKLVEEGPIVVWSELNEKPNSKIKSACSAQFEGSVPDSLPKKLQHFASILCERPVYLKSKLSQNLIEGMGLGFVESAESVERIVRPFQNPLLIRDGHLRS